LNLKKPCLDKGVHRIVIVLFVILAFGTQMANKIVDSLNQLSTMAIKRLIEVFVRV
jgi:hypothetical protein